MYKVALEILEILNNNSYESYIVGGFVRDRLLNIESSDIDIITSAKPSEISSIFNIDILDNYGSINLEYKGFKYDITTFRKEYDYLDNRRPNKIEYVETLQEDLKRRDFTINSICIDKDGNYIDIYNGIDDMNNKIIRCIGDPNIKIQEDSLRILRAIRFASIYNFNISKDLKQAISKNCDLVSNLSFDRIKSELNAIFNSNNCNIGLKLINEFNLFKSLKIEPKNSVICTGNYLSIWAQLQYCSDYNFSNKEKKSIEEIKLIINKGHIDNYDLYKYDLNNVRQASIILNINNVDYMYSNLPIYSRRDINITYDDIKKLNLNKDINDIYIDLEVQILYNKLINKNENIISYIINKYDKGE